LVLVQFEVLHLFGRHPEIGSEHLFWRKRFGVGSFSFWTFVGTSVEATVYFDVGR
jgi:hypothetical protein